MVGQLLDPTHLSGSFPVWRDVGPEFFGYLTDSGSLDDARAVIKELCEHWGGGASLMLPFDRDSGMVRPEWEPLFSDALLDAIISRANVCFAGSWRSMRSIWRSV